MPHYSQLKFDNAHCNVQQRYFEGNVMTRQKVYVVHKLLFPLLLCWHQILGTTATLTETAKDPCSAAPCLHGATCSVDSANATCLCPDGFIGKQCETAKAEPCRRKPCQNGGTCQPDYQCKCPDEFKGLLCEAPSGAFKPQLPRTDSILGLGVDAGKVLLIAVGSMVVIALGFLLFFYACCYCCEERISAIDPALPTTIRSFSKSRVFKICRKSLNEESVYSKPLLEDEQQHYDATDMSTPDGVEPPPS